MNEIVKYETSKGDVELSPDIVRKYICGNNSVTDQEVFMFMQLCKMQQLNPFLREAYLIKYGSGAANIVVGKEAYMKKAIRSQKYAGHEVECDGELPDMTATCRVHIHGYKVPISVTVDFKEYAQKSSIWNGKPKTMLKKVAVVQALREAFPEECGGMYSEDEMPVDQDKMPKTPVDINNDSTIIDVAAEVKVEKGASDKQLTMVRRLIAQKEFDMEKFLEHFGAIPDMTSEQASEAINGLTAKPNKRKEEQQC